MKNYQSKEVKGMEDRMKMYYRKYAELKKITENRDKEQKTDGKQTVETVGKGK